MAKLKSGTRIYGTATIDSGLTVGFVTTSGIITASSFSGSGAGLTGVSTNFRASIGIQSAGTAIGVGITQLNFIGAGNTFAVNGSTVNISIAGGGGGGSLTIQDEGSSQGTATILNFTGAGVNATVSSGTATINVPGGGGGGSLSITDDIVSNATRYLTFVDVTSGQPSGTYVSSTKLTFNPSTGNLVAGGTVTANSDEKLKINIETISDALTKVLSLRGVEYDRIDNGDRQIGVIAQEVEKIIPEVVYPKSGPDYETKSVAYGNLIGLLIEAIKELNQKIEEK